MGNNPSEPDRVQKTIYLSARWPRQKSHVLYTWVLLLPSNPLPTSTTFKWKSNPDSHFVACPTVAYVLSTQKQAAAPRELYLTVSNLTCFGSVIRQSRISGVINQLCHEICDSRNNFLLQALNYWAITSIWGNRARVIILNFFSDLRFYMLPNIIKRLHAKSKLA